MLTEVVHSYSLDDAVRRILDEAIERVRQSSAAPVLLGISGIDCSGKTTLARALFASLDGGEISVRLISVDDFIIPRARRKHHFAPHIDYFENTFDYEAMMQRLESLRSERAADLVIAEGVFLFRQELNELWDLRAWLEMSTDESVRRGSERDAGYFGSTRNARFEYERKFIPAHRYHIRRDNPAETADFVFEVE